MFPTPSLFRDSAAQAAQYRWFSTVLIVTPPAALPTLLLALVSTGCLLLATVVIEVPERVRASGVLLPAHGLLKVRARRSGWVDQLSVKNGENVSSGQPLLWLTDTVHAPERLPENARRLASLHNELRLSQLALEQQIAATEKQQRLHERRLQLLERQLLAARAEYETRDRQAQLQEDRAGRLAQLAADGLFAAHSAEEVAVVALQARAASQTAWLRLLALQQQQLELQQQLLQAAGSPERLRTQADIRREAILRSIAETELRSATVLTAPGDGITAGLTVRPGSFVQAGQLIMTLHDPADRLEARLYVSAENAAMIDVGQPVELQLSAYPHQLFGTQAAVISSISAVALHAQELDVQVPATGAVFEIRAALHATDIRARGSVWTLPPGTEFVADLMRQRWPLYRWLLRAAGRDA